MTFLRKSSIHILYFITSEPACASYYHSLVSSHTFIDSAHFISTFTAAKFYIKTNKYINRGELRCEKFYSSPSLERKTVKMTKGMHGDIRIYLLHKYYFISLISWIRINIMIVIIHEKKLTYRTMNVIFTQLR